MDFWDRECNYDQRIITYFTDDGNVYGGSEQKRNVKQVKRDFDGYDSGGDYTMELDLSNRSFVMEINGEKITIDGNIGDFEYSPIVILGSDLNVTLL